MQFDDEERWRLSCIEWGKKKCTYDGKCPQHPERGGYCLRGHTPLWRLAKKRCHLGTRCSVEHCPFKHPSYTFADVLGLKVESSIVKKPVTESSEEFVDIALNSCFGGFGLSYKAEKILAGIFGISDELPCHFGIQIPRTHPVLIQVIKELGKEADDPCSSIRIERFAKIYKNSYTISEYDGIEHLRLNEGVAAKDYLNSIDIGSLDFEEAKRVIRFTRAMVNIPSV